MGMFNVREPRRFEHKYIYVDERKERLAKIEDRATRESRMLPDEELNPESIRGKFLESTTHLKRRKQNGGPAISLPVAIVLAVLLTILLFNILNGNI